MSSVPEPDPPTLKARALTGALLLAGILGGQVGLYGSSLSGRTLLTPTDLLTAPGELNLTGPARGGRPQHVMMDPVQVFDPWLDFAAREVRAGRLPTWNPYAYCGSPFLANMQSAVFSPFTAVYYLWPDPRALAWIALLKALVAGVGTFGCLRALGLRRWPALVGGWCFPVAGFPTVWLNFPLSAAAVWLPSGMWAVAAVLRRPRGRGGPALAAVTGLMLVSGHLETTAHVLLGMGLFGLWSWLANSRGRVWEGDPLRVAGTTALALLLGLMLGAAQVLPTLDYVRSSHRLKLRREFQAERDYARQTPLKWEALRLAYPLLAGTEQPGSRPLTPTGLHESGANGSVGVILLLLVPIGLAAGRRRSETWLWLFLAAWFAAPMFRVPGLREWDHLPPFHLAANSRALLLTGWSVLVLGLRGLDALADRDRAPTGAVAVSAGLAAVLALGLLGAGLDVLPVRALVPPATWPWFQARLVQSAAVTGLALLGLLVWVLVPAGRPGARVGLVLLALGELLATAHGLNPRVDPATYYPDNPLCRSLTDRAGDGRICGLWGALPPNLAMMYRLRDVRGYDGVDPDPYLELVQALHGRMGPTHALTWQLACGPSPILDLLGVRCIVTPLPRPEFGKAEACAGRFLYVNPRALPRAFVPRRAVLMPKAADRLRRLGAPAFDPRAEVLVSRAARLPDGPMLGSAAVVSEAPDRVVLTADCATEAVVVLADSWSEGWTVRVDDRPAVVLQADHALRAVLVPAGVHRVDWRYRPRGVARGLALSGLGLAGLSACAVVSARRREGA